MLPERLLSTKKGASAGQQAYTESGVYTFVVPAGVTSICAVAIGGGCGYTYSPNGGGDGGSLAYTNNISVTPGESIYVEVGNGGESDSSAGRFARQYGQNSGLKRGSSGGTMLVWALGGLYPGGSNVGTAYYVGGKGSSSNFSSYGGGGGAAGYSGNGGDGGYLDGTTATAGTGGSGGGGGGSTEAYDTPNPGDYWIGGGGGGGGVGILGTGSSGAAGSQGVINSSDAGGGGGGSGGTAGTSGSRSTVISNSSNSGGYGGTYGGGAGGGGTYQGASSQFGYSGAGGSGAVRIIWGTGRSYPSNAANV